MHFLYIILKMTNEPSVHSTVANFVSKKISKIRWQPTSKHAIEQSCLFATGSWDDDDNVLSLWTLADIPNSDDGSQCMQNEPRQLCCVAHTGDITDMQFIGQNNILVASSTGDVELYTYQPEIQRVHLAHVWPRLHSHVRDTCACTAVAQREDDGVFASVGEDGRLSLTSLDTRQSGSVRVIDNADSCTLNAICFLKQMEVATVNSIGQFKIWDLRQQSNRPVRALIFAGERVALHCMDQHPTQPHIVATGGQDGTLLMWDVRQDKSPVSSFSGNSSDMWEVRFHPTHPDHLFTCYNDGALWQWHKSASSMVSLPSRGVSSNMSANPFDMLRTPATPARTESSAWLSAETSRRDLDIRELLVGNSMSVNSLDVVGNTVVCGTDGEQIFVIGGCGVC